MLIPLSLTAAALAADARIHKIILGSGTMTLVITNKEMDDVKIIVKPLEDSALLLKGATKTIENETNEQRGRFLSILLGTVGASMLGNLLSGTEVI